MVINEKHMTQTLIKLLDTHYIIVDDSEIKEGDLCYDKEGSIGHNNIQYVVKCLRTAKDSYWNKHCKKITHSTKPLETVKVPDEETYMKGFQHIKPLSLSEIEELTLGYSVEKMAEIYADFSNDFIPMSFSNTGKFNETSKRDYINGFNAHKELVKDKLFTVEDMRRAILQARIRIDNISPKYTIEEIIQSLLPKTEWECIITPEGKIVLL